GSVTQARLYRAYLRKLQAGVPTLPAAPPGTSLHERGLAWDMVVPSADARALSVLGGYWAAAGGGLRLAGRFPNSVHFACGPNPGLYVGLGQARGPSALGA